MASVDATIAALETFTPANDGSDVSRLYEIFEGFRKLPERLRAVQPILDLVERFPDADFGSPGPLVHELEAIEGYRPFLRESLRRRPTALTVWMVNRILNSRLSAAERQSWLGELRAATNHSAAPTSAREEAQHFLDYQKGVGSAV